VVPAAPHVDGEDLYNIYIGIVYLSIYTIHIIYIYIPGALQLRSFGRAVVPAVPHVDGEDL